MDEGVKRRCGWERLGSAFVGSLALALALLSPPVAVWAAGADSNIGSVGGAGAERGSTAETVRVEVVGAPADAVTATADLEAGSWVIKPPTGFVRITSQEIAIVARSMQLTDDEEGGQQADLAGSVRVVGPDLYATAATLGVDMQADRYALKGGVRLYRWTSERPIHPERLAVLDGDVQTLDTQGQGPSPADGLWGDWVGEPDLEPLVLEGDEVMLDEGSGQITGSGNIHVKDDSLEAWSDAFSYDQDADRVVLTGSVRAVLENQTIEKSPRLVVDLSQNRATIAGPWAATIQIGDDE